MLQVAYEDCHVESEKLKVALTAAQNENARQAGLIQDLENDLMRLQSGGKTPGNAGRSVAGDEFEDLAEVSAGQGNGTPQGRALGIPILPSRSARVSTADPAVP
jgi:hypothetical protein